MCVIFQDSKNQKIRSNTSTIKSNTSNDFDIAPINNIKNIDGCENTNGVENNDNIDSIHNSGKKEVNEHEYRDDDDKYISLYTQPAELHETNDIINNVDINENKENNDPSDYKNKTYISLYNSQSEIEDINDISKPNSYTLGEVRQALNNGSLDEIFPMSGPVYKVNNFKNENHDEPFENKVELGESQVNMKSKLKKRYVIY